MQFHSPREENLWAVIRPMTSDQISRVQDRYTEMMLEPVAMYTNVVFEGLSEALFLLTNKRRKISSHNRDEMIARLFALMAGEREGMVGALMTMGIERNILLDMIYQAMVDDSVFLPGVEPEPLRRHLQVLLADLELFRSIVLNRYIPLITKVSGSFVWGRRQNGLLVESDDAGQNFYMTALRSLDKFDSDNGVLTTFIGRWLRNASHSLFNLHLGESYSITRGVRSKIYNGEADYNNHAVTIHDNPKIEAIVAEEPEALDVEFADLLRDTTVVLRAGNRIRNFKLALLTSRASFTLTPAEIEAQQATRNREI